MFAQISSKNSHPKLSQHVRVCVSWVCCDFFQHCTASSYRSVSRRKLCHPAWVHIYSKFSLPWLPLLAGINGFPSCGSPTIPPPPTPWPMLWYCVAQDIAYLFSLGKAGIGWKGWSDVTNSALDTLCGTTTNQPLVWLVVRDSWPLWSHVHTSFFLNKCIINYYGMAFACHVASSGCETHQFLSLWWHVPSVCGWEGLLVFQQIDCHWFHTHAHTTASCTIFFYEWSGISILSRWLIGHWAFLEQLASRVVGRSR